MQCAGQGDPHEGLSPTRYQLYVQKMQHAATGGGAWRHCLSYGCGLTGVNFLPCNRGYCRKLEVVHEYAKSF
jgi:hypothetical protein